MYILSFAIFILILTIFENIFLWIIALFFVLIISFIINIKSPKKEIIQKLIIIVAIFVLSLVSVLIKNHKYNTKIDSLLFSTGTISQNLQWPQWKYFVWTWIISDIYSYQRFIFQDNKDREYFLYSENKYEIWDIIRLNGYVSIWYTWSKDIFDTKKQKKIFTQKWIFSWLFHYEFNYPKRLMMKWFYGTIYEQNSINISEICENQKHLESWEIIDGDLQNLVYKEYETNCVNSKISFIQKSRKALQKNITYAYWENQQAWLILWMLVWDRSQIPPDKYQWFINSGLVHIIAVSGWNIIMIVVFLWAILFFLPFYVRNAVILITIIIYAMICGMDSSVFRATIMWWLWMLALFRWKEINIRRAMSIAFVIMLIINPYFLAYDVGFVLSFSAIIWIIYFWEFISKINLLKNNKSILFKTSKKITKEFMVPTIWATLWVLPVMLFFMWKTNLTWIIANFLVVPIVAIVMIYGFISTILFKIVPIWLRLWPEKILVNYIYLISDLADKFGIYLQAEAYRIKYALIILFIIRFISKKLENNKI